MTRKSPVRHRVRTHIRQGKKISSFMQGKEKTYLQQTKGYRLESDKLQLYVATDKPTNLISTRNRKIMTILRAEEATSSKELSRRLGLRESTILVELKYLEKEGLVRKIK